MRGGAVGGGVCSDVACRVALPKCRVAFRGRDDDSGCGTGLCSDVACRVAIRCRDGSL